MDEDKRTGEALLAAVFEVGGSLFAIDASRVEEIARVPRITAVRGATSCVLGIANLRGRIITVLDAARLLGSEAATLGEEARLLVAEEGGESIGLVVERLRDVVEIDRDGLRLATRDGGPRREADSPRDDLLAGVFESQGRTVALLDPERALAAT